MSLSDGPFIFVSYARVDSDFVHPEIERLEKQGYRIWYDKGEIEPGLFWDGVIRKAIEACACFIVFVTQDSIDSPNVLTEIEQALRASKPFVSIHWEKVALPPDLKEPMLSRQMLERYALLKHEYEEPLERAHAPYQRQGFRVTVPRPDARPDGLPTIVFLMLVLLSVASVLLAVLLTITPHLIHMPPTGPLDNRLVGLLTGLLFVCVACGLGGLAFALHWKYLRGSNG